MRFGRALRRRYGRLHGQEKFCPTGSEMQTLLFPTSKFTVHQAKEWAQREGFKYGDVDVKTKYIHLRQVDPSVFKRLRNKTLGHGIKGVVGWRKC